MKLNSIKVGQLESLNKIEPLRHENSTAYIVQKMAILTGREIAEIEGLDIEELLDFERETGDLTTLPTEYSKQIDGYILKDFNNLTLGEFITLEMYLKEPENYGYVDILSILYRQFKRGEWGELKIEPLGAINLNERAEIVRGWKVAEVWGAVSAYVDFRENFWEDRKNLFPEPKEESEKTDEDRAHEVWGWELMLWGLCGEDLTKLESVTELDLQEVFLFIQMNKEINSYKKK